MRKILIVVAAAAIGSGGTASAQQPEQRPDYSGTMGTDCVFLLGANPPEYCTGQPTPTRDITPSYHFTNPFPRLWADIESWF